jgi:hypothetical protein
MHSLDERSLPDSLLVIEKEQSYLRAEVILWDTKLEKAAAEIISLQQEPNEGVKRKQ